MNVTQMDIEAALHSIKFLAVSFLKFFLELYHTLSCFNYNQSPAQQYLIKSMCLKRGTTKVF